MKKKAYFATAEELERLGPEAIPPQMISGKHLIYSSPATLAFNSPGAEGFGVKTCGACSAGFHYADPCARMLW
mgnify:CR=1 FL=1